MHPFNTSAMRHTCSALLAWALVLAAVSAAAQEFPAKPIRVYTPFAAGNTLDTALRIVSDRMRDSGGMTQSGIPYLAT